MKSRIFCYIAFCVGTLAFCVLASPVSTTVEPTTSTSTSTSTSTTQENIDCNNPNFKTYIHCLKRQKRHHYHNDDSSHGEYDEICKSSCMKKCEYDRPIRDCHDHCSYCLRKTKRREHVITETEYETESAKTTVCKNNTDCQVPIKDGKPVNVTVIVDINTNTNSANGSTSVTPPVVFPPFPPYPPYPPFPPFPPFPEYPPIPPYPPFILYPPIPWNPPRPPIPWTPPRQHCNQHSCCSYECPQISWQPCIPCQMPRPISYDCSVCNYPQTYHMCTIPCLQMQRPTQQTCVSPDCVGGVAQH